MLKNRFHKRNTILSDGSTSFDFLKRSVNDGPMGFESQFSMVYDNDLYKFSRALEDFEDEVGTFLNEITNWYKKDRLGNYDRGSAVLEDIDDEAIEVWQSWKEFEDNVDSLTEAYKKVRKYAIEVGFSTEPLDFLYNQTLKEKDDLVARFNEKLKEFNEG